MISPFGGFEGRQAVGGPARVVPQRFRICTGKVQAVAAESDVPKDFAGHDVDEGRVGRGDVRFHDWVDGGEEGHDDHPDCRYH